MASRATNIHIPTPCSASWAAMTPTAAGRHCASCQTEVIDFTRMTEAEVLAYLATRQGQHVCARTVSPTVVPRSYKRTKGSRRWLLAVAAFLGWQSAVHALGLPPQLPPSGSSFLRPATPRATVTVRGVVLDDALHTPVAGAYVFIKNTKYGAVTNAKGAFTLVLPLDWAPIKSGILTLLVTSDPFSFLAKTVSVNLSSAPPAAVLIRLLSQPERGILMGKPYYAPPPVSPPTPRKGPR